jgi:hypothetical protein
MRTTKRRAGIPLSWHTPLRYQARLRKMTNANVMYQSTVFLADLSIESGVRWKFLYAHQCIFVSGQAYTATEK